jgi:hypothetical protein
VKRCALALLLLAACSAPAALAWRAPTATEKARIVKALPAFYHQACIRTTARVSSVNGRYAAVFFRFVKPASKGCSPFDGQVLMRRVTAVTWKKVGEGSEWPCRLKGIPAGVTKDLFGSCVP